MSTSVVPKKRDANSVGPSVGPSNPSARVLTVTVHRGKDLPAMDNTGKSDPYCTIQLEGQKGPPEETDCQRQTLNPVWEDNTFDIEVVDDSAVLWVQAWDRDWFLGVPMKPDYMGRVTVPCASIPKEGISHQWFPIIDPRTGETVTSPEDSPSHIQLSLQWQDESDEGLLARFKKGSGAGPETRVDLDAQDEVGAIRAIVSHLKPIVFNIWRVLYVVVRVIMMVLLIHRKILMDWEKPGLAILYIVLFAWAWWNEMMFGLFFLYATIHLATVVLAGERPVESKELKPTEQLAKYKEVKMELKYHVPDPLVKDLRKLVKITTLIADKFELFTKKLIEEKDKDVLLKTFGALIVLTFMCTFFSRQIDDGIFYAAKFGTLFFFIRVTFILPITWRFPGLFPWIREKVSAPLLRFFRPLRNYFRRRRAVMLEKVENWGGASNASRDRFSDHRWAEAARACGDVIKLRKGGLLEDAGTVSSSIYYLKKGKLAMRGREGGRALVLLSSPAAIFTANCLVGHGKIARSFYAHVPCQLVKFREGELRRYLSKQTQAGELFWRDMACDLALELRVQNQRLVAKSASYHRDQVEQSGTRGVIASSEALATPTTTEDEPSTVVPVSIPAVPDNSPVPVPVPVAFQRKTSQPIGQAKGLNPTMAMSMDSSVVAFVGSSGVRTRPDSPGNDLQRVVLTRKERHSEGSIATGIGGGSVGGGGGGAGGGGSSGLLDPSSPYHRASISGTEEDPTQIYENTFGVPVSSVELKQFRGVWMKRGFTKYPGRLFVTRQHVSFYSNIGKKAFVGNAFKSVTPSKQPGTIKWHFPLSAVVSTSRNDKEKSFSFTVDESLQAGSEGSGRLAGRGKRIDVKVFSDSAEQITELANTFVLNHEHMSPRGAIRRPLHPARAALMKEEGQASLSMTQLISRDGAVPQLHGVELSMCSTQSETDVSYEMPANLFSLVKQVTDKAQDAARGAVGMMMNNNNNNNNVTLNRGSGLLQRSIGLGSSEGPATVGDIGLEAIMRARANVLTDEEKEMLLGDSEEARERTLLEFGKNRVILEEGARYKERAVFQVIKGEVQVKKGGQLLATLPEGAIFGEMTFLIDDDIAASIESGPTKTTVRRLTETHLHEVFQAHSGLGAKFYEFLCYVLINRLHGVYVKLSSYDATHALKNDDWETRLQAFPELSLRTDAGGDDDLSEGSE